jgi:Phosphoinositide polyphosphatase (Sac family)
MKFHNPAEFLEDTLLKYFRGMYGRMGDLISLQYGGSIAHKPNIGTKESKKFEFLTSIKRYYSNTFMDQDRQNAINLFLGIYQPKLDGPPVWEMVSPIILAPNHKYLSQVLSSEK